MESAASHLAARVPAAAATPDRQGLATATSVAYSHTIPLRYLRSKWSEKILSQEAVTRFAIGVHFHPKSSRPTTLQRPTSPRPLLGRRSARQISLRDTIGCVAELARNRAGVEGHRFHGSPAAHFHLLWTSRRLSVRPTKGACRCACRPTY